MKSILKITSIFCLTTVLSFQTSASLACSCLYGGEFAKNSTRYKNVIRAKVIKYGQSLNKSENLHKSMIVEVENVIKGNFDRSELELIGDFGSQCREYVDSRKFKIGEEFLFVINNEEKVQELAGCGESSILIDGNSVWGYRLSDEGYRAYSMPLDTIIEQIKIEEMEHNSEQKLIEKK